MTKLVFGCRHGKGAASAAPPAHAQQDDLGAGHCDAARGCARLPHACPLQGCQVGLLLLHSVWPCDKEGVLDQLITLLYEGSV